MKKRKSKSYIDLSSLNSLGNSPREKRQDELTAAWRSRNLKKFTSILSDWHDFEAVYKDAEDLRLIDLLARENESENYIKELISKAPHTVSSSRNSFTGRSAIHYAAEGGNAFAVCMLMAAGADPNVQDPMDETPLHILLNAWDSQTQRYMDCLNHLLASPYIVLNIPNNQGYTPIHVAAEKGEEGIVRKILELGNKLDLDTFRSWGENKTAREVILKNFPDLEEDVPGTWISNPYQVTDFQYRLFYFLSIGQEIRFCKLIREALNNEGNKLRSLLSCCDGQLHTYLHRASERGLAKAVKILIKLGVNVNPMNNKTDPPIVMAARHGHYDILTILLTAEGIDLGANERGETLLHVVVQSRNVSGTDECLRRLLLHQEINVNARDCKGTTALHIAAKNSDEESIFTLLDNGAKMNIASSFGGSPLDLISKATLRKYLDAKITANNLPPKDSEFSISLNYQYLDSQNDHIYSVSTELLCNIGQSSELRSLLAHPIYSTVIFLKWKRIRMLFYLNLFFYSIFCLLTTAYIFVGRDISTSESSNVSCSLMGDAMKENIDKLLVVPCNANLYYQFLAKCFIFLFIIILAATEFFQLIAGPVCYMKYLENWLQLAVIIMSTIVVGSDCTLSPHINHSYCPELSAVTILLIWTEFFFVIGNHPKLTFFIDMFRTASFFLFQFLTVHTTLIIGFALSFHMLFRDQVGPFSTIQSALFKTIVMITGEFDVGEIPLDAFPIGSHILFAAFIFLIAIVLFNLLIGLAVSATKPIEDDAFLFRCIAEVPIISCFEDMYYNDSFLLKKLLHKICYSSKKSYIPCKDSAVLYIFPNQKNRMEMHFVSKKEENRVIHLYHKLSDKIMCDIHAITANKQNAIITKCDKLDELKHQLERVHLHLDEELKIMKTALVEIMEQLKDDETADLQGTSGRKKKKKTEILLKKLKTPLMKFEY